MESAGLELPATASAPPSAATEFVWHMSSNLVLLVHSAFYNSQRSPPPATTAATTTTTIGRQDQMYKPTSFVGSLLPFSSVFSVFSTWLYFRLVFRWFVPFPHLFLAGIVAEFAIFSRSAPSISAFISDLRVVFFMVWPCSLAISALVLGR